MNELRNKIAALKYGERITSPPTVIAFNEAIDDILDLPELQSIIEKAEKYDNFFSSLQVIETHKASYVLGALSCAEQDIYRPLTGAEEEEVFKTLLQKDILTPVLGLIILESGVRVVKNENYKN